MTQSNYVYQSDDKLVKSKSLQEIMCADKLNNCKMQLPIIIGTDDNYLPVIADLAVMPHLIIGGDDYATDQTLNAMILSLLLKKKPEELKLVILDPMHTELVHFTPLKEHYLAFAPLNAEMHEHPHRQRLKAIIGVEEEMNRRYQMLLKAKAHSFKEYNLRQETAGKPGLPYIVMIVNDYQEFAAFFDKRVERPVIAIAQKGRAVGIHVVLRTRNFSSSVITGMLKANFPARISFRTNDRLQSKTILDREGAEILPTGSALAYFNGSYHLVAGPKCSLADCRKIIAQVVAQPFGGNAYLLPDVELPKNVSSCDDTNDSFLNNAVDFATSVSELSAPMLQRRYTIGYNRATRLMDTLIELGVVAKEAKDGKHEVLIEPKDVSLILNSLTK